MKFFLEMTPTSNRRTKIRAIREWIRLLDNCYLETLRLYMIRLARFKRRAFKKDLTVYGDSSRLRFVVKKLTTRETQRSNAHEVALYHFVTSFSGSMPQEAVVCDFCSMLMT